MNNMFWVTLFFRLKKCVPNHTFVFCVCVSLKHFKSIICFVNSFSQMYYKPSKYLEPYQSITQFVFYLKSSPCLNYLHIRLICNDISVTSTLCQVSCHELSEGLYWLCHADCYNTCHVLSSDWNTWHKLPSSIITSVTTLTGSGYMTLVDRLSWKWH